MTLYARLCGWSLARAHARSGDRIALAAYLGGSAKFDQAVRFSSPPSQRQLTRATGVGSAP